MEPLPILPVHKKFLGDGALYLWTPAHGKDTFPAVFTTYLSNHLWNLKLRFSELNKSCVESVPVYSLPPRIRFGLARGTVYELSSVGTNQKEYIGYCINLASRLQKYCPQLGFIASARLEIPDSSLEDEGYIKTVAIKIKGFPKEIVIVDKNEFSRLDDDVRDDLFEDF